jgi:hypothetical protein
MGLALFALMIYLTYMCITNAKPHWEDLKNGEINTVAGKLFKHASSSGKGAIGYCSIQVGAQRFSISPAIYDALSLDDFYRLYYVPHSRKVVNIEPL